MSNLGKTYKRRGSRAPRLTQALKVAHQSALKGGYSKGTTDQYYVEATLAELARRQAAHEKARQVHAPDPQVTTRTD